MAFTFRLVHADGTPAEPPTLQAAVPNWAPGDRIALGARRGLRVLDVRSPAEPDGDPVLVVEPDVPKADVA